METFWGDLRYSIRALMRDRGFAAVAILTLALGIGATTAIFSIVNSVVLQPLAYNQPERLVVIQEVVPSLSHLYPALPSNAMHFLEWRKRCRSFEQISVVETANLNLTGSGEPERIRGARVSANLFTLLGVQPMLGRSFLSEEEQAGSDKIVILTHALWKRRFNSDPTLVGKSILLDGIPHLVVGILPVSFRFSSRVGPGGPTGGSTLNELFKPLAFTKGDLSPFGQFNYPAFGRLKPGVTPSQAAAELDPIGAEFAKMVPGNMELKAKVTPLQELMVGQVQRGLLVLMAAIGAVLLIVCVNLANLMLARATGRSRDAAIRLALGANRWRILRLTLTETVLLGAAGGVVGILLAFWGLDLLTKTAPIDLPRLDEVRLDGRVLGFACLISILSGILFGFLPAWRLTRATPQEILGSGSRTMTEGARGLRLRALLVSLEVGLSTLLLITAGLLMTSFIRLMNVDKGFDSDRAIAADLSLPSTKYGKSADRIRFLGETLSKIEAIPGVLLAGLVSALPLQGEIWVDVIWPEGDPKPLFQQPLTNYRFVSPGYFKTMGIPLRLGRAFEESDRKGRVAIVSERAAKRVWPGENPIGKRFRSGGAKEPYELIGVVGDTRTSLQNEPALVAYVPYWATSSTRLSVVVKTAIVPQAIAAALRSAVWSVDSDVPVSQIRALTQVVADSVAQRRFQMELAVAFAAAALLLAGVGIYGVVAYSVTRRRNEIAIRMALGARAADVHRLVLFGGIPPVALGLAAGVAAALALGQVLRSLLFGVSATDPLTISAVIALLATVAALACYIPALRATRVPPIEALRYQ